MSRLVLAVAALLAMAAPAFAHQGNPNFLSEVDSTPAGVTVEVLNRDDRLLLRNDSGEDVVVEDYEGWPYARIAADGQVFVNTQSKAYYINEERFGDVEPPDDIDPSGPPEWKELDATGRFEWHDHRMHWMSKTTPDVVTDPDVRTTVFTWEVPTSAGPIRGTLFWTPDPGAPVGFIVGGSAVVLAGSAAALVVRRRRDGATEEW